MSFEKTQLFRLSDLSGLVVWGGASRYLQIRGTAVEVERNRLRRRTDFDWADELVVITSWRCCRGGSRLCSNWFLVSKSAAREGVRASRTLFVDYEAVDTRSPLQLGRQGNLVLGVHIKHGLEARLSPEVWIPDLTHSKFRGIEALDVGYCWRQLC